MRRHKSGAARVPSTPPGPEAGPRDGDQRAAILALVDELALLAADLWAEGKLDNFTFNEDPPDADPD